MNLMCRLRDSRVLLAGAVFVTFGVAATVCASAPVKLTASVAGATDFFGYAIAIDGDRAIIGTNLQDDTAGADQGAAYVYRWAGGGWVEEARLTASDAAGGDEFGYSVALSGDTAIIGAYAADGAVETNQGAAYVFTRSGTSWSEQAKLTASDAAAFDLFGISVALSGDTAIVGARADDDAAGSDQGSAYVFTRSGTSWSEQAKLTASDAAPEDVFGHSVALFGDTALVGAYADDGAAGLNQGSAYVFTRSGPSWSEQAKLTASDAATVDFFGWSVALDGDTALVGAYRDKDAGVDSGSAYVFTRSGSSWSEQVKLTATDGAAGDRFGHSVAISGDTAMVGASRDDGAAGTNQGSAHIFERVGGQWVQNMTMLLSSTPDADDDFGFPVAIEGDTAVVCDYLDDGPAGVDQGSVTVFNRINGVWTQTQLLYASDAAPGEGFGSNVSLDGDTMVITAIGDLPAGSVYVFTRSAGVWTEDSKLIPSVPPGFGSVGWGLDIDGDKVITGNINDGLAVIFRQNGSIWAQEAVISPPPGQDLEAFGASTALDGDTAAVGAFFYDGAAGENQGAVYVYTHAGGIWSFQARITPADAAAGDQLGRFVDLEGDTLVASALQDDGPAGVDQGAVYVFQGGGAVWTQVDKLTASDASPGDFFGGATDLNGADLLIGAVWDDGIAGANQGSLYYFQQLDGNWVERAKYESPDPRAGDEFGFAVAVDGGTIIAGALGYDGPAGPNTGAAFIIETDDLCLGPLVSNTNSGDRYTSLVDAIASAVPGDSLLANPASFATDDNIDFFSRTIEAQSRAAIRQSYVGSLVLGSGDLLEPASGEFARLYGATHIGAGATLRTLGSGVENSGDMSLNFGLVIGDTHTREAGILDIYGGGTIDGDYRNDGRTNLNGGVLLVSGSLVNDGVIDEGVAPVPISRSGGNELRIGADLFLGREAALRALLPGSIIVVGGDFDAAVNDSDRFDLSQAELRMDGSGAQTLELMSVDVGPVATGFDRTEPGHYPIRLLRIGPAPTSVDLVDNRDNDASGQATPESLYVRHLVIETGASLNTNGGKIYYESLTNYGAVDDPDSLIQIAQCPADVNGDGVVDGADLAILLASWGTSDSVADLTGDGNVDGADLAVLLASWGAC
jgi:hypothetical protein